MRFDRSTTRGTVIYDINVYKDINIFYYHLSKDNQIWLSLYLYHIAIAEGWQMIITYHLPSCILLYTIYKSIQRSWHPCLSYLLVAICWMIAYEEELSIWNKLARWDATLPFCFICYSYFIYLYPVSYSIIPYQWIHLSYYLPLYIPLYFLFLIIPSSMITNIVYHLSTSNIVLYYIPI